MKRVDVVYTVTLTFCKHGTLFKCSCKIYALFDCICSHILARAEKKGKLKSILDKCSATGQTQARQYLKLRVPTVFNR